MERWRSDGHGRRRAVLALALLAHGVLVATMLRSRASHERPNDATTVEATIWPSPSPATQPAAVPPAAPHPTRLRSIPHADTDPFNHGNERLTGPCIGNF